HVLHCNVVSEDLPQVGEIFHCKIPKQKAGGLNVHGVVPPESLPFLSQPPGVPRPGPRFRCLYDNASSRCRTDSHFVGWTGEKHLFSRIGTILFGTSRASTARTRVTF